MKLPTARIFLREATGRYVSLDGRLWRTLAALLFRPGFLTREYFAGRRRRYIRPARLFLVLSLALFAAIRFFASVPVIVEDVPVAQTESKPGAKPMAKPVVKFDDGEDGGDLVNVPGFTIHVDRDFNLDIPHADAPWSLDLKKRFEHYNRLNRQEKAEQIFLGVVRYGPYAMFVLMPAFALLQMMAYFGRARRYPDRPSHYAEHLVFAAHIHAFLFLVGVLALSIPLVSQCAWRSESGACCTGCGQPSGSIGAAGSAFSRAVSWSAWPMSRSSRWSSWDCCWSRCWCADRSADQDVLQSFATSSLKRVRRVSCRDLRFSMALIAVS